MVDDKTFKCYDLKLDNHIHLGKLGRYLGDDITEVVSSEYEKVKIIGMPAPSCFPMKFNEYTRAESQKNN